MYLEFMRDKAKTFPLVPEPGKVDSLCVWHCRYQTLQPLGKLHSLRALKIASFPDNSFEFLRELGELEWLSVLHLPNVTDLDSITTLRSLRFLELQTLPSWDASQKRTVVESLAPLTELPKLRHLSLLGVVPSDKSLSALEGCRTLRSGKFRGYPTGEAERFFTVSSIANEHMPVAPTSA